MRPKLLLLLIATIAIPLTLYGATDTTGVYTKKGKGTYITGKPTDRWGAHGVDPTVQQTGINQTAFAVLKAKGEVDPTATDYSVQHFTKALTAANLIAMYAAPVVLIPAPGAGKSIVVTKVALTTTRTATAFTGGGVAIVQYGTTVNGAGQQALDSTIAAAVVTGAAGTTVTLRNGAVISDLAAASIQNIGLYISNQTTAFATGTGTATVDVWYYVY